MDWLPDDWTEEDGKRADMRCRACAFCFPKTFGVMNWKGEWEHVHDYREAECCGHGGQVEYGEKLTVEQMENKPNCWALGIDTFFDVESRKQSKRVWPA